LSLLFYNIVYLNYDIDKCQYFNSQHMYKKKNFELPINKNVNIIFELDFLFSPALINISFLLF